MTHSLPDLILEVARRAGLSPRKVGHDEWLVRCFRTELHHNGDAHPSCRLNAEKNTFYCDPCGRGGGVKDLADALGVDLTDISPRPRQPGRKQSPPLKFLSIGPISAGTQAVLRDALDKDFRASTWAAFQVAEGTVRWPSGKTRPAIAFPLPSGGFHIHLYQEPHKKNRWRFTDGGKPDLLVADLDRPGPVLLGEGQWDAMLAHADGFAVATGTGGAGTWNDAWNSRLNRHEIALVLDVDLPGRKGADKVTSSLVAAGVTVRNVVLPLSGTDGDNDLSDYRRTYSIEDLRGLIADTAPVVPIKGVRPKRDPGSESVDKMLRDSGLFDLKKEPSLDQVHVALLTLSTLLGEANPLHRSLCREGAVHHLRTLGLSAPAKVVDAAFSLNDNPEGPSKDSLLLTDPEPWPDPVHGIALCDEIRSTFLRYVALPEGAGEALTLWTLHAFCLDAFFISPILAVISPQKRCGKTTVLDLLGAIVPRRLPASNITAAALFRVIEAHRPTLLIDEVDSFLAGSDELRGVLNSGHARNSAYVIRTTGDNHEPRTFSTWSAKVVALIGRLPGTLEDRSITVPMKRRAPGEKVERLPRHRLDADLDPLRRKAARWAADHINRLQGADPDVPAELHDRAQDNWRPLLAIAELVGGEWPELARRTALKLSGAGDEGETTAAVQLLADLKELFDEHSTDRLSTDLIVNSLTKRDDRPWPEWRKGKPLSGRQLARLLAPFGVKPKPIRIDGDKTRGYVRAHFEDSFSRYLPPHPVHPVQPCVFNDLGTDPHPVQTPSCTGSKPELTRCKQRGVPDVPDRIGGSAANTPSDDDTETFEL